MTLQSIKAHFAVKRIEKADKLIFLFRGTLGEELLFPAMIKFLKHFLLTPGRFDDISQPSSQLTLFLSRNGISWSLSVC